MGFSSGCSGNKGVITVFQFSDVKKKIKNRVKLKVFDLYFVRKFARPILPLENVTRVTSQKVVQLTNLRQLKPRQHIFNTIC